MSYDIPGLTKNDEKLLNTCIKALDTGKCLEFDYDGEHRTVEVHAVGVSTAGRLCMRVFQIDGGSIHNEPVGWKLMSIGKIFKRPKLVDVPSHAPREGYNPGDKGMRTIFKEL